MLVVGVAVAGVAAFVLSSAHYSLTAPLKRRALGDATPDRGAVVPVEVVLELVRTVVVAVAFGWIAAQAGLIGLPGGIGLAVARALAEDGHAITISARRPEKLEQAAAKLRDEGFDVLSVPANMAQEEDIKRMVDAHGERFGRIDVLMNNAGIGIGGAIADAETKKLDMQIDVNLRAVLHLCRLVVPGKQSIPLWLTIIIGIIAAFIAAAIASAIGYANANGGIPWIEIIIQVVIAAIGVSIAAGAYARRGISR